MKKFLFWGVAGILLLSNTVMQAQLQTRELAMLPENVQESSGLLFFNNNLITHNDSGNDPLLYQIDTLDFSVRRSFRLMGAENRDWEDLAEDDSFIYIGDIGNNRGTRTDLKILKISKEDFWNKDAAFPQVINFKYEDQIEFEDTSDNDWDAEALVSWGDSLLVFTKERKSGGAAVYSLPKVPGNFDAKRIAYIKNVALITGASRIPDGSGITLVGYSSLLQPFVVFVKTVGGVLNFSESIQRQYLTLSNGQTEGICALPDGNYVITSESFSNQVFNFPAAAYLVFRSAGESGNAEGETTDEGDSGEESEFRIWYEQNSARLDYNLKISEGELISRAVFDLSGRRVIYEENPMNINSAIDLSGLRTAIYYLVLNFKDRIVSRSFLRY